jgi:hypothetical protein
VVRRNAKIVHDLSRFRSKAIEFEADGDNRVIVRPN